MDTRAPPLPPKCSLSFVTGFGDGGTAPLVAPAPSSTGDLLRSPVQAATYVCMLSACQHRITMRCPSCTEQTPDLAPLAASAPASAGELLQSVARCHGRAVSFPWTQQGYCFTQFQHCQRQNSSTMLDVRWKAIETGTMNPWKGPGADLALTAVAKVQLQRESGH